MKTIGYFLAMILVSGPAFGGKDFERFDGQFYNNKFYPMVDIIEWGEQNKELPHIEFHFHSKEKPMDIAVVPGEKGGRPVLWMMYDLKFRGGEKICRHVLAPSHFRKGMKMYMYRDNSDPDYDNIYVYSEPQKNLKGANKQLVPEYQAPPYERCLDENASNMPIEPGENPVKTADAPGAPEGDKPVNEPKLVTPVAPAKVEREPANAKPRPGNLPVDYDNTAVPFSF